MTNRRGIRAILLAGAYIVMHVTIAGAQSLALEFEAAEALPNFDIDGSPARVHSQGLFVTEQHYYVTGRLETTLRRALLLRFERQHPATVEFVDITPKTESTGGDMRLDHPGGFDSDGNAFWIPVSASRPHSRTVVLRFPVQPDKPLAESASEIALAVDDHIGAIAYDRAGKRLYGANWDTKVIYCWQSDGTLEKKISQGELIRGDRDWALAVQDWKGIDGGRILAGGIDKASNCAPDESPATVALLDLPQRIQLAATRLPRPAGTPHAVTREGLAVFGDRMFFLPDDLGQNAHVFRYRWKRAPKSIAH